MRKQPLFICLLLALGLPAWSGNLTVAKVWPEKLCYKPGETAKLAVEVANAGVAVAATVSLKVNWGLEETEALPDQGLAVPAKGTATTIGMWMMNIF